MLKKQYMKPFNCVQKERNQTNSKILSTKRVDKSYIFNIYLYKNNLVLDNLQGLM